MTNRLAGQRIIVTGASSGIGYVMAEELLIEGAIVAIALRPGEKLGKAVRQLKDQRLAAIELPLDVRSEKSVA